MGHLGTRGDGPPIAAPRFQQPTNLGIEIEAHSAIIAKLCANSKQHIARQAKQSIAMTPKSLNQNLAANLARLMQAQRLSESELGRKAKVAANTIGNYLEPQLTPKGKERSAKLVEVEKIATALGVTAMDLLAPSTEAATHRSSPSLAPVEAQVLDDLRELERLDPDRQLRLVSDLHNAADHARAIARRARETTDATPAKANVKAMAASAPRSLRSRLTVKLGDGNPDQGTLPLSTVDDPFSAEPSDSEQAWYDRLSTAKGAARPPK